MCEERKLNGGMSTQLHVVVPKTLYDELSSALSRHEINDAVVASLKESLRKIRFKRDLERTGHHKHS